MMENNSELPMKDGIPIQKGVVLNSFILDKNRVLVTDYLDFWMQYPDLFLDAIQTSTDKYFKLLPYQRIALRASLRYRYHSWTATRATSKSFTAYLSALLVCVFRENSHIILVSDTKETVVKTARAKFDEIFKHWPLLRNELTTRANQGEQGEKASNDYFELNFKNGSKLSVITISQRGFRATGAIAEECATINEIDFNEVVAPTMNVPRRNAIGYVDPNEPSPTQIFITTASTKTCFMYGKLIELTIMSVLRPDAYFVWGLSYEVPVHYGLLNKEYLNEQKYSSTFSAESFARESMSIWTGANSGAWFEEKTLIHSRTLLHCEREAQKNQRNSEAYYQIGVDVGRYKCNTAIVVCKVLPNPNGFKKNIVYVEVINGESFIQAQAPRIKELIERFNPREVVMDGNGLGCGLLDAMAAPSVDMQTGKTYPAYFVFNNDEHLPPEKKVPSEEPMPAYNAIIYDMKANSSNDSLIHANIYAQFSNGMVSLLANERIVKEKLLATQKGRHMDAYSMRQFLLPYEMTSRLIDEMNNLKLKQSTGVNNQTKIEQISTTMPKDRFSALEYVLWRVKYYEDIEIRKLKKRGNVKDLTFFTPHTRR